MKHMNNKIGTSFGWKLLERFGVQGAQFVLQLVLARILDPGHYGALGLMIAFVNLANVFVQNGFNMALIQNKDVTEEDYSSVFWVSIVVAGVLYAGIFFGAPFVGAYYEREYLVAPLRVLGLMLFPNALNSVQISKIGREMDFKKVFYSNIAGVLVSGAAGIAVAKMGGGLWALVVQTLTNVIVTCLVMLFTTRLKLRLVCSMKRVVVLFSFGWKILVSSLLETAYQEARSLIIGKKYSEDTLGYYNRGKQFPQFINSAVNGAVQSVMLPALSVMQDDIAGMKALARKTISISCFVLFPVMSGLAAVASPMVSVLLTDKWLPCVPYLQAYCFSLMFLPVHTCNLQAINAMGRSDIYLRLEIIKKIYGLLLLVGAVVLFDTPIAIALSGVLSAVISTFVNAQPNKKLIGYSYLEQVKDMLPSMLLSLAMFGVVQLVGLIEMNHIVKLLLQIVVGAGVYVLGARVFMKDMYAMILGIIKGAFRAKKGTEKI